MPAPVGVMRAAVAVVPARGTGVVAGGEVAGGELPTPTSEMPTADVPTAEVAAATSEVSSGKSGHRRTRHRKSEQQRCDDPNQWPVRRIHSSSPRRTAAVPTRTPAIELDAPRAHVFKLTCIKTR